MRLTIYNQINDMIETLMEAVNYMIENNNKNVIEELLTNSQLVLASIDEALTHNTDSIKDPIIIEHLQKCTNIVKELKATDSLQRDVQLQAFDSKVKQLQIMFHEYVNYKIRVVFFAELGQKWDAMNSVYKAFMDRGDCEVRVVLTPIFRRVNIDGEIKTDVIYEDYLTDLGIDFLHYEEYDISKDLPDMAFISNPYESVTIKDFWPENIAKYTRLVYIPYFTSLSISNNTIEFISKMPFTVHAWKIIQQTDALKDLYKKYSAKKGKNVIVSNLTKWDELNKVSTENIKPEFTRLKENNQKVFLWNTHYTVGSPKSTLIYYGLELLEHFKNRLDISLIWRPHPMTETVLNLYSPEYLNIWNQMIDIVNRSENIVIDENSSYKQAFAVSDALISDYSSLIAEYLYIQKPILFLKNDKTDPFLNDRDFMIPVSKLSHAYEFKDIEKFVEKVSTDRNFAEAFKKNIEQDIPQLTG